jgi:hypothetical protein
MREKIQQAVQTALTGSRKVKITFKRDATDSVGYLLGMGRSGLFKFMNNAEGNLMAVAQSRNWGSDQNRSVTLELTPSFDLDWFSGRLDRALENIVAIN